MRVYIHIPFCRQRCGYCHFALTTAWNEAKVAHYCGHVLHEVEDFFAMKWPALPQGQTLESIYFGGWTPSAIEGKYLEKILLSLQWHLKTSSELEITVECNGEDISEEKIRHYEAMGVTRISLGVQSLSDQTLSTIGRGSRDSIFKALDILSRSSIPSISVDFIAGLPHEAPGDLVSNIREVYENFRIEHVSVYMLEQGEKYPRSWGAVRPNDEAVSNAYLSARDYLLAQGFRHYELSNFALPGHESRHNRGYWQREEVAAFGLSAAGFDGKKVRYTRSKSFTGLYQWEYESETLSDEQTRIEKIMMGVRTFSVPTDIVSQQGLSVCVEAGYLDHREGIYTLTDKGLVCSDAALKELV